MSGTALVKATPIPSALADVGVKIGQDDASGMQIVLIPPEVREKVNVLDPVSSFAQADPNWTPAIRLVQLSADLHSFPSQGKKALNKQGLELLARAGGIMYSRVDRVKQDELAPDEPWAYRGTIGVRRSDGTIDEVTRERSAGDDAADKKFGREKTQSKAVLRAIRAALQIPHAFTAADFAKPFLVIGYSFTPDYNDVDTKRALVAAGLNAHAALYGGSDPLPALPAAETNPDEASAPDGVEGVGSQQAGAKAEPREDSASADAPVPGTHDDEPSLDDDSDEDGLIKAAADAAAMFMPPNGQHKNLTLSEILATGEKGEGWLRWALRKGSELTPDPYRQAVWSFARVYAAELYTQVLGELEASS